MPPSSPDQLRVRARFERLIGLAAPFLDVVLATGDRVSRIAAPEDDYIPIRAPGDAFDIAAAQRARRLTGGDDGEVG